MKVKKNWRKLVGQYVGGGASCSAPYSLSNGDNLKSFEWKYIFVQKSKHNKKKFKAP